MTMATTRTILTIAIVIMFTGLIAGTYLMSPPDPANSQRYLSLDLANTGASNRVSGIYLNTRLFDTLLEILVFSVAVLGVRYYLSHASDLPSPTLSESAVVRTAASFLSPLALLLSVFFAVFGHLSPGGGFAAGVIAASAVLYVAISQGMKETESRFAPKRLATIEKILLLLVLTWGLVPITLGLSPLSELLPKGTAGQLLSGGSILPYNILIGTKVFLGAWLIIAAFAQHRGEL